VNCVVAIDDVDRNDKNGEVRDLVASRALGSGTFCVVLGRVATRISIVVGPYYYIMCIVE